jgi:hypothetical protein
VLVLRRKRVAGTRSAGRLTRVARSHPCFMVKVILKVYERKICDFRLFAEYSYQCASCTVCCYTLVRFTPLLDPIIVLVEVLSGSVRYVSSSLS